jgi:hypothetical protein
LRTDFELRYTQDVEGRSADEGGGPRSKAGEFPIDFDSLRPSVLHLTADELHEIGRNEKHSIQSDFPLGRYSSTGRRASE